MKFSVIFASLLAVLPAFAEPGHQFPPIPAADLEKVDAAVATLPMAKAASPRKVLIFFRTEGFVHPSIPIAVDALEKIGRRTGAYTSVKSEDMAMFDAERLRQFDAVIFVSTTDLKFTEPARRKALLDFVRKGGGLVGIHAASDNFKTWPEMSAVLGGLFKSHPWHADAVVAVKLDDPAHPLNAAFGEKGFWVRDEIYQIVGSYARDKQRVLMSLDMAKPSNARDAKEIVRTDRDFPIAWIRKEDNGRVFYSSLGHNPDVYWQPEVLQHFYAGILYALNEVTLDETPSARISAKPATAPDEAVALQDRKR